MDSFKAKDTIGLEEISASETAAADLVVKMEPAEYEPQEEIDAGVNDIKSTGQGSGEITFDSVEQPVDQSSLLFGAAGLCKYQM